MVRDEIGVRHPYLMSVAVAISSWFCVQMLWRLAERLLRIGQDAPLHELGGLLGFLAGCAAWEWLKPIRTIPTQKGAENDA